MASFGGEDVRYKQGLFGSRAGGRGRGGGDKDEDGFQFPYRKGRGRGMRRDPEVYGAAPGPSQKNPEVSGEGDNPEVSGKPTNRRVPGVRAEDYGYKSRHGPNRQEQDRRAFDNRACFRCGKTGHQKRDCPVPAGPADGSQKRQRPVGNHSGLTPAAKRLRDAGNPDPSLPPEPRKRPWSYAQVVSKPELKVVFVRLDEMPVRTEDWGMISRIVDSHILEAIKKGEEPPTIMNSVVERYGLVVDVADDRSGRAIRELLATHSYRALTPEELEEKLRPTKKLSGFVRGPTADLQPDEMRLLIKHQVKVNKINGVLEFVSTVPTRLGGIVRIKVDEVAEEALARLDYTLGFGFAGAVKFNDLSKTTSERKDDAEAEKLDKEIEAASSELKNLEKKRELIELRRQQAADAVVAAAEKLLVNSGDKEPASTEEPIDVDEDVEGVQEVGDTDDDEEDAEGVEQTAGNGTEKADEEMPDLN